MLPSFRWVEYEGAFIFRGMSVHYHTIPCADGKSEIVTYRDMELFMQRTTSASRKKRNVRGMPGRGSVYGRRRWEPFP